MRPLTRWDDRFLELARFVASWSKDPSTQTGAVITDPQNRIVSMGFNGLPRGVADTPERLSDRRHKYELIVHCEANALLFAHRDLTGCRLYTYPFVSCVRCAGLVVQSGISEVIAPAHHGVKQVTLDAMNFDGAVELLREAGVDVCLVARERE